MFKFFCGILFVFFLISSESCIAQYRSKPIGISKRKYKQIKARKYVRRERAYVPKQARYSIMDRMQPRTRRVSYVNANAINRKRNRKAITYKRRRDNDYRDYRDYLETSKRSEKSNFSIYDK